MSDVLLDSIRSKKGKILNKLKDLKVKINKKIQTYNEEFAEIAQSYESYYSNWSNKIDDCNTKITQYKEKILDLDSEKGLIESLIKEKETTLNSRHQILKKFQHDNSKVDYMLQKENDNLSKTNIEKEKLETNDTTILNELNFMLKTYKSVSCFQFEKTYDGLFKITFKNILIKNFYAYITLSVSDVKYTIVECFPNLCYKKFHEELEKTHNLTVFLMNLYKEFSKIAAK